MLVDGIDYEVKSMPNKCARAYNILDVPNDGILRFKEYVTIHKVKLIVNEIYPYFQTRELAEKVKEIIFHDSIKYVGSMNSPITNIRKVTFGRNMKMFPQLRFLKYLEEISFHPLNKIKIFEAYMFQGCCSLRNIELPYGLDTIGKSCFEDCWSLERIKIPDYICLIHTNAFSRCYNLREFIFPGVKPEFRPGIFNGCRKVKRIAYVRSDMVNYFKKTKDNPFHEILPISLVPTANLEYVEFGKTQIQLIPSIKPELLDTCQYRNEERGYILVPEFRYIQGEKKKVKLHPLAFYNCQEPITVMLPKSMKNKHGLVLDNKVTLDWY